MSDLQLSIVVNARPSVIFKFMSDPEAVQQWLGNMSQIGVSVNSDVSIRYPNGDVVLGKVLERVPDRKIVFSWGYEGGKHGLDPGGSKVTITLEPTAAGTKVTLQHDGLTPEQARNHSMGWNFHLGNLEAMACEAQFGEAIPALLMNYTNAWNSDDEQARAASLEKVWASDGVFADRYGRVIGRDALKVYIANARRMMPGATVSVTGRPRHLRGRVLFDWAVAMGGNPVGTGASYVSLNPAGQIEALVSFWN